MQHTQDDQGNRLALLAVKCLLHCLRGHARTPVTRGGKAGNQEHREGQPSAAVISSVEVEADKVKNSAGSATTMGAVISGATTTTACAAQQAECSGNSSLNNRRGLAPRNTSPPPRATLPSRRKSSFRERKNSATTGGKHAAKKQRSKNRLSLLQWRVSAKATPPTAAPEILGVDREHRDMKNDPGGGDNEGHIRSVEHSGEMPEAANVVDNDQRGGGTSSAGLPSNGTHQYGGRGMAAAVYAELDQLGASVRVSFLLTASCPLRQELGVAFLAAGLRGSAKKTSLHGTR